MDDNIFEFIEAVHGEEILWNICSKYFKDIQKKNKTWTSVGAKFGISGILLLRNH